MKIEEKKTNSIMLVQLIRLVACSAIVNQKMKTVLKEGCK